MLRRQAYKFELKLNGEQQRQVRCFAGACRFVYNRALTIQKELHANGKKNLGYVALCRELTTWRHSRETPWLYKAPVHPLQQALKSLDRAYRNFFEKRAEYPRFKQKGRSESFLYPDAKQAKLDQGNSRIFLPKLGWLRYRNSREVLGTIRNITVKQSCDRWFVSIQTETQVAAQVLVAGAAVGIDLGVTRFATLSDGTSIKALNIFKKHEQRLRRHQRRMSRKVKLSNNWKKAKSKIAKIHSQIANARRDYLHKTSTAICQKHAMVCIEDLKVKNMSRSAAGCVENPGKKVRAKSGLNKSILDQGWREFRRQLEYKLDWAGGLLVVVPPKYTSQTCPHCGHLSKANRPKQAIFACVNCGYTDHADVVGAINILARGHRVLACGEAAQQDHSKKQEPTEAITSESPHA